MLSFSNLGIGLAVWGVWMIMAPFFLLMCLFGVLYWICKKHKRPMAVNAIWTSLICFVFAAFAMWMIVQHWGTERGREWRGRSDELCVLALIDVLVLIVSATVCVICCRHICRLPIPPSRDNQIQHNRNGNKKGE